MPNTHAIADSLNELMCTWGDLGPQVIVSHSGLTVPASSLTLAAVAANGYVLSPGPPARLVYVSQPAVSVTLSATNGPWWLALHADLHTPVSGWTRRAGSHFLVQQAATQPANPSNALVFCQVTVSGGVITAVSPLLPVTSQPMSKQNSNAVAITGGTIALQTGQDMTTGGRIGIKWVPPTAELDVNGTSYHRGNTGMGLAPGPHRLLLGFAKDAQHGLEVRHLVNDTGFGVPVYFTNLANTQIGSISSTASSVAYNTSSDIRLKRSIQTLLGGLEALQRMRPVSFVWNSTDEPDIGFLAHELMTVAPQAVTGQPDEVNPDGSVKPQQVDQSKLVPLLVAAVKELLARVEVLEQALA